MPVREDHLWVSRRLIYGQAALLGFSAATFFVLGLMVGNLTSTTSPGGRANASKSSWAEDCRITGAVTFKKNGRQLADVGAVVILVPQGSKPDKKQAPGLIMPETFVALDNPTIESIHLAGGAVVRSDADGKFNVLVDGGRKFDLVLVSKNCATKGTRLTESQARVLEDWFAPAEKLIRNKEFQWREFSTSSDAIDLGNLAFD